MSKIGLSILAVLSFGGLWGQNKLSTERMTAIAKEAYLYGYPMVENYRVMYQTTQNKNYPKYAPVNQFYHDKNVATPLDTLFVAPNGDTPYSTAVIDLSKGPVILTIPPIDPKRYVGFPVYDLYTYVVTTFSKRTIGTQGGKFLLVKRGWKGNVPKDIKKVVTCETNLLYLLVRTQLFGAEDLAQVHALQAKYKLDMLPGVAPSKSLNPFAEKPLPADNPYQKTDPRFFSLLAFLMGQTSPMFEEKSFRASLDSIGIKAGQPFSFANTETKKALMAGIEEAKKAMVERLKTVRSSVEFFGTREQIKDDYLARATGAWVGIYANQKEEFLGINGVERKVDGTPFTGKEKYTIYFAAGQLPPVDGFWSITVYSLPNRLMYANEINRQLINSAMVPNLKKDENGGITIYLQHQAPSSDKIANWLPTPPGAFTMSFRCYLPQEPIRNGSWQSPPVLINPL